MVTATEMDLLCAHGLAIAMFIGELHLVRIFLRLIIIENREMKQIRTGNVSRLSANREEIVLLRELRNGLWTCR